jgi:transglutaminase-like putative cysteine protease
MTLSDFRQKAVRLTNQPGSVRIKIKSLSFADSKSLALPIDLPKYSSYLVATPYLDSDVATVKAQASKIVGTEKNGYKAASKIRAWIYGHLKADSSIGITRSASDVLKSKKGVCRDYGILFAALARAAGIPSKIVAGVLYSNGGFYYHVWVECFVGEWVPFDATLPTDYVDATHIKMAEGDATSMFSLSRVIGSLKAEIKDFK